MKRRLPQVTTVRKNFIRVLCDRWRSISGKGGVAYIEGLDLEFEVRLVQLAYGIMVVRLHNT